MNRRFAFALAVLAALALPVWAAVRITDTPRVPARQLAGSFNAAPPGANTDILAADLSPAIDGSAFRVTVALTTASVFNVTATDGTTTHVWSLNSGTALNADDLYTFTFATDTSLDFNFQVPTNGTIEFLSVQEVVGEGF